MNIKRAKEEIRNTIEAYLLKNEYGEYEIPVMAQRPVFLIGAPGIGKTQIMEQISRECKVGLVSYTITHHTRQSAIGLPFISRKNFDGKEMAVTEYTMSEIVASIYEKIQESGLGREFCLLMRSTVFPRHWHLPCCSSFSVKPLEATRFRKAG
ncbi:hypothetical protein [Ruminococcus sp. AM42-11]|uniref:hypothetical protein n=1 Tax=Ruminococcus sp. AM42-11 TaxID=2292372 RepID=UPI0026D04A48